MSKELENAWAVQEIWQNKCYKLEEENKTLKLTLEQMENTCKDYLNDRDTLREENRKLNERIRFLEQCLDNKEKVNISLREEIRKLKKENKKLMSDLITTIEERDNNIKRVEELEKEIEEYLNAIRNINN